MQLIALNESVTTEIINMYLKPEYDEQEALLFTCVEKPENTRIFSILMFLGYARGLNAHAVIIDWENLTQNEKDIIIELPEVYLKHLTAFEYDDAL